MSRWHKIEGLADLPERAFIKLGGRMTLEGGGGEQGPNTTNTSNLPEYARPYFTDIMAKSQQASMDPYTQYAGQRTAGFAPEQQQSQSMVGGMAAMGTPQGLRQGQNITNDTATNLAGYQYRPNNFSMTNVQAPGGLQNHQMSAAGDIQAPGGLQRYQMGAAGEVGAGQLGQQLSGANNNDIQSFMNPYQQDVVDLEKAGAARDYKIAGQQRNAQAVNAGAFGGSRQAVAEAEAQKSLMSQMQGIQTKGSQAAYDSAQQNLQAERAANMQKGTTNIQTALQAALANQNNQQQANSQNLNASLQTQGLGAGQALQAAMANQGNRQQANSQNLAASLQTQALGSGQNLQAALANQQANMGTQQASEASRQFGASSGLQAMQQFGQMGSQLGQMGEADQTLALQRTTALNGAGNQRQAQQQTQLDNDYRQWAAARDYDQNMINWQNQILRGTPISMDQTVYQTTPGPSYASQIAGMVPGIAGLALNRG